MPIKMPVQALVFCQNCQREGMVSFTEWEIGESDVAIVANFVDLSRDGFVIVNSAILCKECHENAKKAIEQRADNPELAGEEADNRQGAVKAGAQ